MNVPNSNLDRDDQSARAQAKNASTLEPENTAMGTHLRLVKTRTSGSSPGRGPFGFAGEPEEMSKMGGLMHGACGRR